MKALLPLLFIVLTLQYTHAQDDEDAFPYDSLQTYTCGWNKHLTVEQRNAIFPFSESKRVVLIAYPNHLFMVNKINEDSLDIAAASKYYRSQVLSKWIVEDDDRKRVYFSTEEIELTKTGINQLSNLLFNYTTDKEKKGPISVSMTGCYEPRNAILFFNEKNEIIACIEICFECSSISAIKGKNDLIYSALLEFIMDSDDSSCIEKFTLLHSFFKAQGVKFGIEEN
ncbi:hypothetical protein [Flavobacterium beibuense]|uniref:hypothetical protein n=1 Tax=Flavobacterium beibuense TaxID=657326 RepID=UPI003A95675B